MSQRPTISILTPTHNRPEKFKRLMDSIESQSFTDFEVIINNDTDDVDIDSYDDRFNIEYNKYDNYADIYQGLYNRATSDILWVMEDDDYLAHDGVLEMVVDMFNENDQVNILLVSHFNKTNLTIITHGDGVYTRDDMCNNKVHNQEDFQFGDMIIKRSQHESTNDIKIDISHLKDRNEMCNDFNVYLDRLMNYRTYVRCTNEVCFVLTYAEDNLTWGH